MVGRGKGFCGPFSLNRDSAHSIVSSRRAVVVQVRPVRNTKLFHSPHPAGSSIATTLCFASSSTSPLQPPPSPLPPPPLLPLFPPAGLRGRPVGRSLGFLAAIRWCVGARRGPPKERLRRWPVRRARLLPRLARLRFLVCVCAGRNAVRLFLFVLHLVSFSATVDVQTPCVRGMKSTYSGCVPPLS